MRQRTTVFPLPSFVFIFYLVLFHLIDLTASYSATCLIPVGEADKTHGIMAVRKANDAVLIIAEKGLFRLVDNRLLPIIKGWNMARVSQYYETADGTLLIGGQQYDYYSPVIPIHERDGRLFRLSGDELFPIGGGRDIGWIMSYYEVGDGTVLIGAGKGLFRIAHDTLSLISTRQDVGFVQAFHRENDGALLIGSSRGLFRLTGDRPIPLGDPAKIGTVMAFQQDRDGTLLIGTSTGIFRRAGGAVVPIGAAQDPGSFQLFQETADTLLIGAENGLFRRHGSDLIPIGADRQIRTVTNFYKTADGTLLVRSYGGLFRRVGDNLIPIRENDVYINDFYPTGDGAALIGMSDGVFRLVGDNLVGVPADQEVDALKFYHANDGTVFVGAYGGLFQYNSNGLISLSKNEDIGSVVVFNEARNTLLVGTSGGLFRLFRSPWTDARVESPPSRDIVGGLEIVFRWKVAHGCASGLAGTDISLAGVPNSWITDRQVAPSGDGTASVRVTINFPAEKDVAYEIRLLLKENTGEFVPVDKGFSVHVK